MYRFCKCKHWHLILLVARWPDTEARELGRGGGSFSLLRVPLAPPRVSLHITILEPVTAFLKSCVGSLFSLASCLLIFCVKALHGTLKMKWWTYHLHANISISCSAGVNGCRHHYVWMHALYWTLFVTTHTYPNGVKSFVFFGGQSSPSERDWEQHFVKEISCKCRMDYSKSFMTVALWAKNQNIASGCRWVDHL